jgi:hypothetical protein
MIPPISVCRLRRASRVNANAFLRQEKSCDQQWFSGAHKNCPQKTLPFLYRLKKLSVVIAAIYGELQKKR